MPGSHEDLDRAQDQAPNLGEVDTIDRRPPCHAALCV